MVGTRGRSQRRRWPPEGGPRRVRICGGSGRWPGRQRPGARRGRAGGPRCGGWRGGCRGEGGTRLRVVDDLHVARGELAAALDLYRCGPSPGRVEVLATAREAPEGAEAVALGPLDEAAFADLCRAVGIGEPERIAAARAA